MKRLKTVCVRECLKERKSKKKNMCNTDSAKAERFLMNTNVCVCVNVKMSKKCMSVNVSPKRSVKRR